VNKTEWWQRGPVDSVPAMVQPVAHIVLQIGESVRELVAPLTASDWNARPAGIASVAFHVRHIIGVMDRLFTYARGDALSEAQFVALRAEGASIAEAEIAPLLTQLDAQVAQALTALRTVDPHTLGDYRDVGRAKLPSTVIGCLVHGAEHGMRHVGQLSVTARVVRGGATPAD
jgi:DinB superfamily